MVSGTVLEQPGSRQQVLRTVETLAKGRGDDAGPQDINVEWRDDHLFKKHVPDTSCVMGTELDVEEKEMDLRIDTYLKRL